MTKPLPMFPTDHIPGPQKIFDHNIRIANYLYLMDLWVEYGGPQPLPPLLPPLRNKVQEACDAVSVKPILTKQDEIVLARLHARYPRCETPASLHPSMSKIITVVAEYYKLDVVDIISRRRTRNVVLPRQISMYLIKQLTLFSFPEIGRYFGNKDHTTVLHAVRKIDDLINGTQTSSYCQRRKNETNEEYIKKLVDDITTLRGVLEK